MAHHCKRNRSSLPRKVLGWIALLVVAAVPVAALAEDAALPSGEELMDRYVEALGGREAMEKHVNCKSTGKMTMVGIGLEGTIESWAAKPNKTFVTVEIEGMGKIERGTAGDVAWELSPFTGPRILEGDERDFMLRESTFNGQLEWSDQYEKVQCVGTETVGGLECYTLELTPPKGKPLTLNLSKETHLPVSMTMSLTTAMGEIPIEMIFEDYKETAGVMTAGKITQKVLTQTIVITAETVEFNVEIPEDRFDLPEEIQELLKKKQSDEKPVSAEQSK